MLATCKKVNNICRLAIEVTFHTAVAVTLFFLAPLSLSLSLCRSSLLPITARHLSAKLTSGDLCRSRRNYLQQVEIYTRKTFAWTHAHLHSEWIHQTAITIPWTTTKPKQIISIRRNCSGVSTRLGVFGIFLPSFRGLLPLFCFITGWQFIKKFVPEI